MTSSFFYGLIPFPPQFGSQQPKNNDNSNEHGQFFFVRFFLRSTLYFIPYCSSFAVQLSPNLAVLKTATSSDDGREDESMSDS